MDWEGKERIMGYNWAKYRYRQTVLTIECSNRRKKSSACDLFLKYASTVPSLSEREQYYHMSNKYCHYERIKACKDSSIEQDLGLV